MRLEDILIIIPKLFDFTILVGESYCGILILLLIVKLIDKKFEHNTKDVEHHI